jgi:hypothetical protein
MLRHPVYREIDQSVTLWGLEPDDIIVLTALGYVVGAMSSYVSIKVGPIDATLFVSFGAIAAVFSLWLYFRRGKPRYFLRDIIMASNEPDAWVVTPDLESRPVVRGG